MHQESNSKVNMTKYFPSTDCFDVIKLLKLGNQVSCHADLIRYIDGKPSHVTCDYINSTDDANLTNQHVDVTPVAGKTNVYDTVTSDMRYTVSYSNMKWANETGYFGGTLCIMATDAMIEYAVLPKSAKTDAMPDPAMIKDLKAFGKPDDVVDLIKNCPLSDAKYAYLRTKAVCA